MQAEADAETPSPERVIFVFGSNQRGVHGAGAARDARLHHGAIWGKGEGLQGNSYAIPTKDSCIRTLPIDAIQKHVERFLRFAAQHPTWQFNVTRIGCGLAGYADYDIQPLFASAPKNCILPQSWGGTGFDW